MAVVLVDTSVVLDMADADSKWHEWAINTLEDLDTDNEFVINQMIYAEVSIGYDTIEECEALIRYCEFLIRKIPREALFLAGKAFVRYRRKKGIKTNILPDFFIGAHAAVDEMRLLTRDRGRFSTYFPTVNLIMPQSHGH